MASVANSTTSSSQVQMVHIASSSHELTPQSHVIVSAQFRRPSLELIEDPKQLHEKCVPLQKLAMRGDWTAAKRMIDEDRRLLNAAISKNWVTLLHVAVESNHVQFTKKLIALLEPCDLELQDSNENTAFCLAAASGNMEIAALLIKGNGGLPQIRGGKGMTPLYMAALQEKGDMARYLYPLTCTALEEDDWVPIFFLCIKIGLYDIALQMLRENSKLASARNEDNNETGLHVLARKPIDFSCQGRSYLQNQSMESSVKPTPVVELVRSIWNMLLRDDCTETEFRILISHPSQVIFDATEAGNFHFVAELMRSYPDLMWEVDAKNRSVIHIAVLLRHSSIFNLIYEIGSIKDLIATFVDDEENNILHYAAKLAPAQQLKLISGAALQMTHEVLWFEEVEKNTLPSAIEKKNSNGKTPRELFVEEHRELLTKAEYWTKSTANNCMLVSTLIATGVFTATFNIPGGRNNNTGTPNYLQKSAFVIFAVSDAIALISSSASILTFLSILISSYAEDNYFRSLPVKLLFGLMAQLVAITGMMVAFSVAFFITYYHGLKWISNLIFVLAFMPIPLFACVLFPLWSDIVHSSYFCMSLFRPRKQMLY